MQVKNNQSVSQQTLQPATKKRDNADFQKALADFYLIHEQSQITGVSTYIYNKAIEKLGFKEGENLKAIQLLKQYAFDTGAPSIEAITKYGDTTQEVGNHTYMKNNNKKAKNLQTNSSENKADTQKPYNYFDAAKKLSQVISKDDQKKTLATLLKKEKIQNPSAPAPATNNDLLTLAEEFLHQKMTQTQPVSMLNELLTLKK